MTSSTLSSRLDVVEKSSRFSPQLIKRLGQMIESAPEEQLYRTNPGRMAKHLGTSETETLELLLHATHAGIFDFSWGVLCLGCASFITTPGGLQSLGEDKWCNLCRMPTKTLLDDNVEVAFTVSPSVRRIRFQHPETLDLRADGMALFFSPSLKPESVLHNMLRQGLQLADRVAAGESQERRIKPAAGRYLLMFPASHSVLHFVAGDGAGSHELTVELMDGSCISESTTIAAGDLTLRIRNLCMHTEGYLLLADPIPPPELRPANAELCPLPLLPFLTGKRLITSQSFRTLFRAESIPSEGGLELKNLTILFTDLKGSTELYERIGDFKAYDLVRQHFRELFGPVALSGGAVVKTIGDAIMASFSEPAAAVQAAVTMNREVRKLGGGEDLQIKLGLHTGPCIAVELNDRLDFFGRTVNIAARVQGVAQASEIVCTAEVHESPGVAQVIRDSGLTSRRDEVTVKGIAQPIPIVRLQ